MGLLSTIAKCRVKTAIAVLVEYGALNQTTWDTSVRNFGQPRQLLMLKRNLFTRTLSLKPRCASVLNRYDFTGDLSSEAVLKGTERKLHLQLKRIGCSMRDDKSAKWQTS